MRSLSAVLIAKILITIFAWCIPLLLLPVSVLERMGFEAPRPEIFLRLLGMAYASLAVGYAFGLRSAASGIYPTATIVTGIVSNGGACALLAIAAIQQTWASWGVVARGFMWGSLLATGLITLGLVVYGPLRSTR